MKEHKTEIAIISIINLAIIILTIIFYPKIGFTFVLKWYQMIILLVSFITGMAVLDITICGLIILWKKGFSPVILITILVAFICITLILGIGYTKGTNKSVLYNLLYLLAK